MRTATADNVRRPTNMTLADLLKDSAHKLTQFKPAQIAGLEAGITSRKLSFTVALPQAKPTCPVTVIW